MARVMVGVRVSETSLAEIDALAEKTGATRSLVARVLIGEALRSNTVKDSATNRLMSLKGLI